MTSYIFQKFEFTAYLHRFFNSANDPTPYSKITAALFALGKLEHTPFPGLNFPLTTVNVKKHFLFETEEKSKSSRMRFDGSLEDEALQGLWIKSSAKLGNIPGKPSAPFSGVLDPFTDVEMSVKVS